MIIIKIDFYIVQLLFCKTLERCSMKQSEAMNNEIKKQQEKMTIKPYILNSTLN
jgi:hypothetical protein